MHACWGLRKCGPTCFPPVRVVELLQVCLRSAQVQQYIELWQWWQQTASGRCCVVFLVVVFPWKSVFLLRRDKGPFGGFGVYFCETLVPRRFVPGHAGWIHGECDLRRSRALPTQVRFFNTFFFERTRSKNIILTSKKKKQRRFGASVPKCVLRKHMRKLYKHKKTRYKKYTTCKF